MNQRLKPAQEERPEDKGSGRERLKERLLDEESQSEFFDYWESLGFFENIQASLPREFFLLFEIARLIESEGEKSEVRNAIEEIMKKDPGQKYEREKSIQVNRLERNVPVGENMEIQNYKTIYDLKRALPRELTWGRRMFDLKLFTKTLLVQKNYESESDIFKPVYSDNDNQYRDPSRFDQKFYLLLDRSRSMEKRMRSFYSKSIVVEFLKRKLEGNARLYYRPFDSLPGRLFRIETRKDFTRLIERVLLTTTGGTGTNIQKAVFQAIDDIQFDRDMSDAEILVVTDGLVHNIDIEKMKEKLGDIKLNFFKIGLDLAEPDGYEMKKALAQEGYNFDPFSVNIKKIREKLEMSKRLNFLSADEQKVYEYIQECSEKIINDLREISNRFIEIEDINTARLKRVSSRSAGVIVSAVAEILNTGIDNRTINELAVIYKKAYFLGQYIEFLMGSRENKRNPALKKAAGQLLEFKQKLLMKPGLPELVLRLRGFENDRRLIKKAYKEEKNTFKEETLRKRKLTYQEIMKAKTGISKKGGKGNIKLLYFLFLKLWKILKQVFKR